VPFAVTNPWFSGEAEVATYVLDELLGTKLRALYQRRKGRDLFDLWHALRAGRVDSARLLSCFHRYMTAGGHGISRALFEENLALKRAQPDFRSDMAPILRPGVAWDVDLAMDAVLAQLVAHLPGDPWRGEPSPPVAPAARATTRAETQRAAVRAES
jgi:hypothetical protein